MKAFRQYPGQDKELISSCVFTADSFFLRLSGLILRKPLQDHQSLLITGCKSIHTVGMRYNIDAVFIDRKSDIVAVFEDIAPWRSTPYIWKAHAVLESKSGFIKKMKLGLGDRIIFE